MENIFTDGHFFPGNDVTPSPKNMESIEDTEIKPKVESPPPSDLSLITPVSEEASLPTPLGGEQTESTSKVNLSMVL